MGEQSMFLKTTTIVRWLLGIQYLISGINWWYKMLPFPSLHDGPGTPQKHQIAVAMIATGWMFGLTKAIEIGTGLSLLLNRFVPLMLVVSMAVAVTTFLLDAFIGDEITGWFAGTVSSKILVANILDLIYWGGAVLVMQVFLMLGYLHYYRPMLVARAESRMP
jgi:hypothetical protein